jgi:hypothetical protein
MATNEQQRKSPIAFAVLNKSLRGSLTPLAVSSKYGIKPEALRICRSTSGPIHDAKAGKDVVAPGRVVQLLRVCAVSMMPGEIEFTRIW